MLFEMSGEKYDLSLHLVTDRNLCKGRPLADVIATAVHGGVTVVQLREKECSTREFYQLARALSEHLKPLGVPLIINDRSDIALAVGAQGLHIGQSDIPYAVARQMLGPKAIIGLSVESVADAMVANKLDVDYLGLSPVFSTATKTDIDHQLGLAGVRAIRTVTEHFLVAIGGVNDGNIDTVLQAGADGIAVVSAICSADQPACAAQLLKNRIDRR